MKTVPTLIVAATFGAAVHFAAQPVAAEERHHGVAPLQVAQAAALADGEVRKVDKDAKKLTIKHGPLLDMSMPMTMVYQVKDPAMLDQVKAGDKIKFSAEKVGGAYTVTRIEK